MIETICPECEKTFEIPDETMGESISCPNCGATIEAPDAAEDEIQSELEGTDSQVERSPSKTSWLHALPEAVSGGVLFVLVYVGGFALHVWTSALFWERWGHFWGIVSFLVPFVSEAVAVLACFWWHTWYFILAIALWLLSLGGAVFLENETHRVRFRIAAFIAWISLICVLSGTFGHFAWKYSLGPTSRSAGAQAQLEDCAVAILSALRASGSSDPSALASLVSAKDKLKKTIHRYDKNDLDDLCALVDQGLVVELSMQEDFLRYMEESRRNGGTGKFKISEHTRKELDKLPAGMRSSMEADSIEESEAEVTKRYSELAPDLPDSWRESVRNSLDRTWRAYARTYSELLGRSMPSKESQGNDI